MSRIQVWATGKDGEGYVQDLGIYDELEDIRLRPSMFAKDVLITFEELREDEEYE